MTRAQVQPHQLVIDASMVVKEARSAVCYPGSVARYSIWPIARAQSCPAYRLRLLFLRPRYQIPQIVPIPSRAS